VLVDAMRKFCKAGQESKATYMRMLFKLLSSDSSAVMYQCATTLVSLSGSVTAVKAAAATYTRLLQRESDNNIRLIVLERLGEMRDVYAHILEDSIMDILAAVEIPNLDVRKRSFDIAMDLLSSRNVDEVIQFLKKQLVKSLAPDSDKNPEYLKALVDAVGTCVARFPQTADGVVIVLMDLLSDAVASAVSVEVIGFIRAVVESFPQLRPQLLEKLRASFTSIGSARVFRTSLWILGDYSETSEEILQAFSILVSAISPVPLVEGEAVKLGDVRKDRDDDNISILSSASAKVSGMSASTRINADGTYASQFSLEPTTKQAATDDSCKLRTLIRAGDYYLASVLASTLTKLSYLVEKLNIEPTLKKQCQTQALLILASMLRYGKHEDTKPQMDDDSFDRIALCLQLATNMTPEASELILKQSRDVFSHLVAAQKKEREKLRRKTMDELNIVVPIEQCVSYRLLKPQRGVEVIDFDDEQEMARAVGNAEQDGELSLKLDRILQLTGFSDPIYAEASITMHQFDIIIDLLIANQTNDTLENISVELSTTGDLKLCERPPVISVGPMQQKELRASVKVSSTDNGAIFGSIAFDQQGASVDRKIIVLNEIHVDIMDYIQPGTCNDMQFRSMWAEFEWENKVTINSDFNDLTEFLKHIMAVTKMNCLTQDATVDSECTFLSANLYAKSTFGEDALANVSVEKIGESVVGYVRIRSKTQGIALSLGERITSRQRKPLTTGRMEVPSH
jgi:coatomer subunit beta